MKESKALAVTLGVFMSSFLCAGMDRARADSVGLLETAYEVDVKGITVLDVKYSTAMSGAGFHSQASVKTRGIAAFFSDYVMKVETSGSMVDGKARPKQFTSVREKKDKTKKIELSWDNDGLAADDRKVGKDPDVQTDIDGALTSNVTDMLTAILQLGISQNGGPCQSTHRVFDGKEVFELRFAFKGEGTFDSDSEETYHGPVYECQMTYVPVAGRYATKFRASKEEPPVYSVWLAPIGKEKSGAALLLPVRASGKLDGYKFVANAKHVKVDGQPFNQLTLN
jgi:hypothetical protein